MVKSTEHLKKSDIVATQTPPETEEEEDFLGFSTRLAV
jgi:hypothetical protein